MFSAPQLNTSDIFGKSEVALDLDAPYNGSNISQAVWIKALGMCNRANAVCEVAKVLFDEIFTDDEVIHCTYSGRGTTKKFNPNKVTFLKKATAWIMTTRSSRPWEFSLDTCEDINLSLEDETGVRGIEKRVFTEYRSRRRGDILRERSQKGTKPLSAISMP